MATVLRQQNMEAQQCIVQCTPANKIDPMLRKLTEKGYDYGPDPITLTVFEGQHLQIKFRGNIGLEGSEDPIDLVYNTHIETKTSFVVDILDTYAQKSIEMYRGFAQLYQITKEDVVPHPHDQTAEKAEPEKKEKKTLLAEHLISLPKVRLY